MHMLLITNRMLILAPCETYKDLQGFTIPHCKCLVLRAQHIYMPSIIQPIKFKVNPDTAMQWISHVAKFTLYSTFKMPGCLPDSLR